MEFYECKVKYQRNGINGEPQTKTEIYLVEAVSFADAEQHTLEEIKPFILGGQEVEMKSIRKMVINELLPNDQGLFWYKAKIEYQSVDPDLGKEKKVSVIWLIQEASMENAYKVAKDGMDNAKVDYTIKTLQVTGIVDVLRV